MMNLRNSTFAIISAVLVLSTVSIFSMSARAIELTDMCESDCKNELLFFRKYSKKGSSLADLSLAIMYYRGIGTERNLKTATRFLYKSARAGEPGAQYQLGYFLMHGLYLEQDLPSAKAWFKRAAKRHTLDSKQKILEINNLIKNEEKPTLVALHSGSITPSNTSDSQLIENITVVLSVDYRQILEAAEAQVCTHESCGPSWTSILAPLIKIAD